MVTRRRSPRHRDTDRGKGYFPTLIALPLLLVPVLIALLFAPYPLDYPRWWYANSDPPVVQVTAPGQVVRGTAEVTVRLAPPGRTSLVDALLDGKPFGLSALRPTDAVGSSLLVIDTRSLSDGPHRLELVAEDFSRRRNSARATVTFASDNTPPSITWVLRPSHLAQGRALLLMARSDEPASLSAMLGERSIRWQQAQDGWWAMAAFGPDASPGPVPLHLVAVDSAGNEARVDAQVDVAATPFPREDLDVSPELSELVSGPVRQAEEEYLTRLYTAPPSPRAWRGPFLLPVQGPVVTQFGTVRSYNHGPPVGHHLGSDIAVPAGTFIRAPNRGKVVLAEPLRVRGNTVVLDHGGGIFTTYAHLSETLVQPGEEVQKGQAIGRVGSTGLSTGPHLHWELWVDGVPVDPLEWVEVSEGLGDGD